MRKFERLRHVRYFSTCLQNLPKQYSSADTNRLTLVHFCVQALDLLGCLPDANVCGTVGEEVHINREGIIAWIYALQTLPTLDGDGCAGGGFKGGAYLGPLPNASDVDEGDGQREERHPYDHSHLAMTYVALCTLAALGDDLSRVNKTAILKTLQSLQKEDGSFVAVSPNCSAESASEEKEDDDCDLRFMYTAIAIWYLLTDPTNSDTGGEDAIIDVEAATSYILRCIAYDGALGLTPGREGHGGSTFCGTASLYLMGVLDDVMNREELSGWRDDLIRWCVTRQHPLPKSEAGLEHNGYSDADTAAGMQGRPNKLQDTCYSYWIGGTLHLLGESHLLDRWALREYVLMCQSPYGGFGKVVGAMPDLLHSFYSLAWLALSKEQGCCEEDNENDVEEDAKVGYDNETRQQVVESIDRLSKLDCALGICAKRHDSFHSPKRLQDESL